MSEDHKLSAKLRQLHHFLRTSITKPATGSDKNDFSKRLSAHDQKQFDRALELYKQGVDGDGRAVQQAYTLLQTLFKNNPNHRRVEAYLGCVTSLLGRDTEDISDKIKYALEGLKRLDKVVAEEPDNIEYRGLRGFVCLKLPETYFHRSKTAVEDFSYLVQRYERDQTVFCKSYYEQILFQLGNAYQTLGLHSKAKKIREKLLASNPEPQYAKALNGLGLKQQQSVNSKTVKTTTPYQHAQYALPFNYEHLLKKGAELHQQALAGDGLALTKGLTLFERAHKALPTNPLIMAYYADLLSLSGKEATDTSEIIGNAMKAISLLDQAVNLAPDNFTVLQLRANHSFRLPEAFFRRTATAISDYWELVSAYENDPTVFSKETYCEILYNLGMAYRRLDLADEARETWIKLFLMDHPSYREQILTLLDDIPSSHKRAETFEELLDEGIRLYEQAIAGHRHASFKAKEVFERALALDPSNPLIEGYYGSCLALAGRDSMNPNDMYTGAHRGLAYLNRAIDRAPQDYRLRILRGFLLYNLPRKYFSSLEEPIGDLRFLKTAYHRDPTLFPQSLYVKVLQALAVCYERTDQQEKAQKIRNTLAKKNLLDPKSAEEAVLVISDPVREFDIQDILRVDDVQVIQQIIKAQNSEAKATSGIIPANTNSR